MNRINFPLLLSGPILRRTEPTCVTIWVATSQTCQIQAEFYQIYTKEDNQTFHYQPLAIQHDTNTIKLGNQLYIHLIKVNPFNDKEFPMDTLLGYNLFFNQNSELHDLESLGLLSMEYSNTLVYGNLKYPTFQMKSTAAQSRIIYGSCRKPHGHGEDCLTNGDLVLEKEYDHLKNRPDALFLMGDQIYADDVADPLIRALSTLGSELIGHEKQPHELVPQLNHPPYQTALNQINGRQFIMEKFCQFTSSQAQNHLIKLGEFAAMYLLSWSPILWEVAQEYKLFESYEDVLEANHLYFAFPNEEPFLKKHRAEEAQLRYRFEDQQEALISFQHSLWRVQRLLANIPTYMIFDDHDLTDDWNISADWKQNVSCSPLGRHVVANGLSAYWAFQGWGNDPDCFSEDFLQSMNSYFEADGQIKEAYEDWVNLLWDFSSWHFVAPTHPKALFLDIRTQRGYDLEPNPVKFGQLISETINCPRLINESGWMNVTKCLYNSGWKSGSPLMIVSATPVYGMGLIESFLHDFVYPLRVLGLNVQTSFDFEAWKYNGKGFTEFLLLAVEWNPDPCIILSGDVHYASSVYSTVTFAGGRKLDIKQFTSSPFKNMSFSGIWGLLMKTVIGINTLSRKNKIIRRICTSSFTIQHVKDKGDMKKTPFIWKDELMYQFVKNDSIIETKNNIGLLTITPDEHKNTLETYPRE
ncbi:hypothetical protein [Bacillus sp. UNC438CL73TsuS30]|uniref:hypothetical protein n=1 Tax=Bacillus sp. UNC438CL73TsuS30 TaxID=1340434 RepID=UPI0009E01414|nr:hypothetical protein [Bacillus sp. UNC438CL73TsuS30]